MMPTPRPPLRRRLWLWFLENYPRGYYQCVWWLAMALLVGGVVYGLVTLALDGLGWVDLPRRGR